jgi:hypothetical protein
MVRGFFVLGGDGAAEICHIVLNVTPMLVTGPGFFCTVLQNPASPPKHRHAQINGFFEVSSLIYSDLNFLLDILDIYW